MRNAVLEKSVTDPSSPRIAWRERLPTILVALVVVWTLTMLASLHWRFLDRFVVGAKHGMLGLDFFATPRAFCNLMEGNSIFLTESGGYGPHASWYVNHPMLAVAIGSWTALFPPWIAYGLFVAISIGLLALSAWILAWHFEGKLLPAFTLFALFCSLPTYLMLWNAQMHVLLTVAVALMLSGMIGLERDEKPAARWLRMIQFGVLISLLSKPLVVLALPALFATRETRRALFLPVAIYAAISLLFLLSPTMNAGGYNGVHWLNVINGSSPNPFYSLVFPRELNLVGSPEIYSLPTFMYRLTGKPLPGVLLKLPVLLILAMSMIPLFLSSHRRRMRVLMATLMLCILSHFLAYYMVWEYHYTTILPIIPVLWWMSLGEEHVGARWLLRVPFFVLFATFLPTLYFLDPEQPLRFLAISTLLRVVPVLISFVCLVLYGVGNGLAAWKEGQEMDRVQSPIRQFPEIIKLGTVLGTLCGIVMVSVFLTVPLRLTKPWPKWSDEDRITHCEDLVARGGPGLVPMRRSYLHCKLGKLYAKVDPVKSREHYTVAVEQMLEDLDLGCAVGQMLVDDGQVDFAKTLYQRVLQLSPDHAIAKEKLHELEKRERGG